VLVDAAGRGETRPLKRPSRFDFAPAWSPDGKHIAFASGRYDPADDSVKDARVWLMNIDGSSEQRLSHVEADERDPQWN
jgi:Tol biopolymer transport system component